MLVIDDEAAVRTTAAAALRRYGYRVEVATDGAAGVEAFRRRPSEFVAVLLDLTMPVMGGEEALATHQADSAASSCDRLQRLQRRGSQPPISLRARSPRFCKSRIPPRNSRAP